MDIMLPCDLLLRSGPAKDGIGTGIAKGLRVLCVFGMVERIGYAL